MKPAQAAEIIKLLGVMEATLLVILIVLMLYVNNQRKDR